MVQDAETVAENDRLDNARDRLDGSVRNSSHGVSASNGGFAQSGESGRSTAPGGDDAASAAAFWTGFATGLIDAAIWLTGAWIIARLLDVRRGG